MSRSARHLAKAWIALMALTAALALVADARNDTHLGVVAATAVAAAVTVKSRIILRDYLGLKSSASALGGFTTAVAAIVAIVALSLALQLLPHPS